MEMAKRLLVLLGMLALMLAAAVPALAQQAPQYGGAQYADDEVVEGIPATDAIEGAVTDVSGSVVLVEENPSANSGGKGYFTVTDETEITKEDGQAVPAAFEDLEVGQVVEAAYADDVAESYPTQGNAGTIAILEEAGRSPDNSATFTYELAVECEPPAGAEFLGFTATESLVTTPLTDPDGDGIYTGSQTVPRFAPGGPEEPITISPVRIVQGPPTGYSAIGPEYRVLKDFGPVRAEDVILSASVSYCDGGSGGAMVSGDTSDNEGIPSTTTVLPATGGILPIAGLVGLVTIFGGLVARRIIR